MTTTSTTPSDKPSGTPAWVAIVGVLVALGGLLWGIASFFIVKPEPIAKPIVPMLQQNAEATGGNAVNATGGATVSIGAPTPDGPTNAAAGNAAPGPASQKAKAGPGGTAINAADKARVSVQNH